MAEFRDPLVTTCEGCRYNRPNNEGNCSRYVKMEQGRRVLCGNSIDDLGNSNTGNCMLVTCPEHCYLNDNLLNDTRYYGNASNIFTGSENISSIEELFLADQTTKINFINGINTYEELINNGPYSPNNDLNQLMQTLNSDVNIPEISGNCRNGSGCNQDEINTINENVNTLSSTESCVIGFRCSDSTYRYGNYNLPNVGGSPLINQNTISSLANNDGSVIIGTKWDILNVKYDNDNDNENGILSGDYNRFFSTDITITELTNYVTTQNTSGNVNFHKNGIDFSKLPPARYSESSTTIEWYRIDDTTNSELSRLLQFNNLTVNDLPNIYTFSTAKLITLIQKIRPNNNVDEILKIENRICPQAITEYGNRRMLLMGISSVEPVDFRVTRLIDIFGLTQDTETNNNLEINLNILLNTDDNDEEFMDRIGNYNSIEELGRNFEDIQYIERKIKKFLGTNTEEFVSVYDSSYTHGEICTGGFSERPMKILGNLMNLDIDHDGDLTQQDLSNEKRVFRIILKYIPSLMRKVLDISERLEILRCNRVTKKTQIYKEIYTDLFIDSNVLKFELPDLGISDFFKDFNHNIYTKIILLIFIGFIISRIISLFSVNVQVKA